MMIRVGSAATGTNTELTATATGGLRDGATVRKPAGEIAACLPGKPKSTAAEPTFIRGGHTTTTRTTQGGSSFGARSLRFTLASTLFAKASAAPNRRVQAPRST